MRRLDWGLLLAVVTLMGVGLVQIYSASYIFATERYGNGLYFFVRQLSYTAIALTALLLVAYSPMRWTEKMGWVLWPLAIGGVALTLVPGWGIQAGGASRWIHLPLGLRFEPAELLKVALPLLVASFLRWNEMRSERASSEPKRWILRNALRVLLFATPLYILLKQPDFGSFVLLLAVAGMMLFAFGLKWRYVVLSLSVALPSFYFLIMSSAYRRDRLFAFLDPWSDPSHTGFQSIQSMLSFHSGGLTGVGLGQGQGKLFFLPEAHTDFTLAVLAEETGFLGLALLLALYGYLVLRGFQLSIRASTIFRQATALGLSLIFAFSVIINSGVAMGILPTKGLTLPFLSSGGSSLLMMSVLFGFLLQIERAEREEKRASV